MKKKGSKRPKAMKPKKGLKELKENRKYSFSFFSPTIFLICYLSPFLWNQMRGPKVRRVMPVAISDSLFNVFFSTFLYIDQGPPAQELVVEPLIQPNKTLEQRLEIIRSNPRFAGITNSIGLMQDRSAGGQFSGSSYVKPTGEQAALMDEFIHLATGLRVVPNDVTVDNLPKIGKLSDASLTHLLFMLMFTGRPGYFEAADITSSECFISKNCARKENGYQRLSFLGVNASPYLFSVPAFQSRKLAATAMRSADPRTGAVVKNRVQVSHLCHIKKCFNPEHLMVESRAVNLARRRCNAVAWCSDKNHPTSNSVNRNSFFLSCLNFSHGQRISRNFICFHSVEIILNWCCLIY